MKIPVLIERVANHGFRAKTGEPVPLSADGASADDAVRNLRAAFDKHLAGKQLSAFDTAPENAWLAMAGIFDPNDPLVQEWKKEMAEYRREVESDPNRP